MRRLLDKIFNRKRCYQLIFLDGDGKVNPNAEVVLADLKRFCRAQTSTAMVSPITKSIDPIAMAMAEGRREVWNRIQAHLHLEDKTVTNLRDPYDEMPDE
jgi:hypothetical protein